MHDQQPITPIRKDRHYWLCLAVGTPILVGALLILALVGWAVFGFRADAAPHLWMHNVLLLLPLVLYGGLATALGGTLLWIVVRIVFALGEGAIDQWRRVCQRSI